MKKLLLLTLALISTSGIKAEAVISNTRIATNAKNDLTKSTSNYKTALATYKAKKNKTTKNNLISTFKYLRSATSQYNSIYKSNIKLPTPPFPISKY
ncbi:MAG: hypothetical protein ACJAZS_000412 [Alteromonas naphthalenivorans]|jgi:hypothetical protein